MTDAPLSASLRSSGQQRFYLFAILNGFSFGLLAENVLVLFALKSGVPPYLSGVLVSFMFVGMPFMVLGKRLMHRYGAAGTHGLAWAARNLSAMVMATAPFLYALHAPAWAVTVIIVFCAFCFYAFRAIGIIAHRPLIGEVTIEADRGRFLAGFGIGFNASYLIAIGLFAVVMRFFPSLYMFQIVIYMGCVAGLASAALVTKVPETPGPRISARQPTRHSLIRLWHTPSQRRLLFAQMAGWASFSMTVPFSMVALKDAYGASDFHALLFILIQVGASLLIAMLLRRIADRLDPRRILIAFDIGFILLAALWIWAPARFNMGFVVIVFLLGGMCKSGLNLGLNHYFLHITPQHDRVIAGMLVQVLGGISAGVAGSVISGGLLKLLSATIDVPLQQYRIYFTAITALTLPFLWLIWRLKPAQR